MKNLKLLTAMIILLGAVGVSAQDLEPKEFKHNIRSAYVPAGFDSNDKTQFVIAGDMPSTCYRVGPLSVKVNKDTKVIQVKQRLYKYNTICLYMLVPFHKIVDVGILPSGEYSVVSEDEVDIGKLPIKKATTEAADDYLYAPVTEARVKFNESGEPYAIVEGSFSNSCMRIKELKVFPDGDRVLTVLPVSENVDSTDCTAGDYAFRKTVDLPKMPKGRYLLNVRSLNGEGLFKFFDTQTNQ